MKKMNKWPIFLIALFLALPWLLKTNNLVSAAVSVSASPMPRLQFLDANGNPYVGGKLYTYYPGTTVLRATYTDSTGSTQNANPIILDSIGSASVWLSAGVKFILYDSNNVLVYSQDNVSPGAPAGTFSSVVAVSGPSFLGSLQVTGTLNAIGLATFQGDITTSSNSTSTFNGPVIFAGGANYQSNIQTSAGKTAGLYYVGAQELTVTGKTTATGAIVANGGVTGNLTGNVTGTSVVSSGTMTLGGSAISVWPSLGCNSDCIFAGASAFQGSINTSNGTSQSMYYLGAQEFTVSGMLSTNKLTVSGSGTSADFQGISSSTINATGGITFGGKARTTWGPSAKIVSFNGNSNFSGGQTTITGVGFTPNAVICETAPNNASAGVSGSTGISTNSSFGALALSASQSYITANLINMESSSGNGARCSNDGFTGDGMSWSCTQYGTGANVTFSIYCLFIGQ